VILLHKHILGSHFKYGISEIKVFRYAIDAYVNKMSKFGFGIILKSHVSFTHAVCCTGIRRRSVPRWQDDIWSSNNAFDGTHL